MVDFFSFKVLYFGYVVNTTNLQQVIEETTDLMKMAGKEEKQEFLNRITRKKGKFLYDVTAAHKDPASTYIFYDMYFHLL